MNNKVLLNYISKLTNVPVEKTTYLTHGIHQYPAKYIPDLPRVILNECTKERNTILDPFCGSGTTLLEAALAGRNSIGIDSNPIAALISKAKTMPLNASELESIDSFVSELEQFNIENVKRKWIPAEDNLGHWFKESVITELSWLKDKIEQFDSENLKVFLTCIFSSIIVTVSNQESNTRYAAKDKNIKIGDVIKCYLRKLKTENKNIKALSSNKKIWNNIPDIICEDLTNIKPDILPDNSVDIIITSPPYANSYDYYLYHKWRMVWLGYDFHKVQEEEIGSRHEHSSKKAPLETFEKRMVIPMSNLSRVLKPNKLAFFFVGDSIISGELINMSDCFKRIAAQSGFSFVCETSYSLPEVSRCFLEKKSTNAYGKSDIDSKKMQRVLVFEPCSLKTRISNTNKKIAVPVPSGTPIDLNKTSPRNGSVVSLLRYNEDDSIHGIGKYPAKFIPDIPRWAIKKYSKEGDTILDPFNGSGTTIVEALKLNRNCIGIDVSPYACLLARAKKPLKNIKSFEKDTKKLINYLKTYDSKVTSDRSHFENDLFWFDEANLKEFEFIWKGINTLSSKESKDFFLAIMGMVVKPCSYLDESQIKVKRSQKKLLNGVPSPIDLMRRRIDKYISIKKNAYSDRLLSEAKIIENSVLSVDEELEKDSVDLIVTSPPYINAMNYPMNHRYESFLLKILSPENSIRHQQDFIGTERVYSSDYSIVHQFPEETILGNSLNDKLIKIYKGEPKRSYITYNYFAEMHLTFLKLSQVLKAGGAFVIVAGTNTIKGVPIDTFKILKSDLLSMGYEEELTYHYDIINNALKITRHKTADIIKYDGVAVLRKGGK